MMIDPVHPGQANVHERQMGWPVVQKLKTLFRRVDGASLIAFVVEYVCESESDYFLVIHDEHAICDTHVV